MKKNFIDIKNIKKIINIGFFTSKGGVSKGDYYSLNCSKNNEDRKNNVLKNINTAIKQLSIEDKKLKLINQIHSKKTFVINNNNSNIEFYGDGLITKNKNIALGILTADCVPIFIFDLQKSIICGLHSGWKGGLLNIAKEGIKKIKNKKIENKNIIAVVGPCLGFNNFEVDKKFKFKFKKKNSNYLKFFKYKNRNKDLFNLRGLINYQIKAEGINKIYNINRDTYKNSDIFFSHRRSTHQNKIKTGRMINIISFKD